MNFPDYERASACSAKALDLMERSRIPPAPAFYELFYIYAAGTNPALNGRVNTVLNQNGTLSVADVNALCEEFLGLSDIANRIRSLSQSMSRKILDVHDAIDVAMATAHSYSGSLEEASGDLDKGGIDAGALKLLASRLLDETRQMQATNQHLESQLELSRDDISVLQRDLDEVRREAMLDPLTKIPNRKGFDDQLAVEIEAARSLGHPLALLLLDIDHFKAFNDSYGHLTGDQVLCLVAQVLKSNLKGRDMPARFGGEEFVAILPETGLAGATAIADTIRRTVQAKELLKRSTNEKLGRITLSVGVALWRPEDTEASFIERADHCLYAAKNAGRNRVVSERELVDVA